MTRFEIIPLPRHGRLFAAARDLSGGVLRVLADPVVDVAAVSAVSEAAYALPVTAAEGGEDADVIVAIAEVPATRPTGADPRPEGRRGQSEAYAVRTEGEHLLLTAASAEAAFRGLLSIAGMVTRGSLPAVEIVDHPAYAWRGLSLDVVRRWFPVAEILQVIDLLAVHKMNVLHLHLTDSQAWRFDVPDFPGITSPQESYSAEDLRAIEEYARARFVTIVPELDVPGHVAGTVIDAEGVDVVEGAHPFVRYLRWGDAGVAELIRSGFAVLAACFSSPYLHLGGDEAFGAPHEVYTQFIREVAAVVRGLGRTPLGWQEAVRSGAFGGDDLLQLWIAERDRFDLDKAKLAFPEEYHPLLSEAAELFALSGGDPDLIGDAAVPIIVSSSDPLYLDRRTSDPSRSGAQQDVWARLGHPGYDPTPTTSVLDWDPRTQSDIVASGVRVAGIEAALWCESVRDIDDVATLLLPRLALIAQRAWSADHDHDHDRDRDREAILTAAAAQAAAWSRLGFSAYYRSAEVFAR